MEGAVAGAASRSEPPGMAVAEGAGFVEAAGPVGAAWPARELYGLPAGGATLVPARVALRVRRRRCCEKQSKGMALIRPTDR